MTTTVREVRIVQCPTCGIRWPRFISKGGIVIDQEDYAFLRGAETMQDAAQNIMRRLEIVDGD